MLVDQFSKPVNHVHFDWLDTSCAVQAWGTYTL